MIIGLCGYKGSGKSTVTETAINLKRSPWNFFRMGFSDPLYAMLIAAGVPSELVYNKDQWDVPLDILCGRTIRYACDTLGTEWGQEIIGREMWSRMALDKASRLVSRRFTVILDNVRFPHEASAVLKAGGVLVAFERKGLLVDTSRKADTHVAYLQKQCTHRFMNHGDNLATDALALFDLLEQIASQR